MLTMDKIAERIIADKVNIINAVLYQDGKLDMRSFHPVAGPLNCYSISKNFTATAIGIACDKGLLTVEDKIVDIFADKLTGCEDEKLKDVTVAHLLSQTTGINKGFLFESDRYNTDTDRDWLKLCLNTPLPYIPGEVFTYSNTNYYVLSCVIKRVSGLTLERFLKDNFFNKLGIYTYAWERCPYDENVGATGLYLYTHDMIKLGIVYMNGGEGIISPRWINAATVNQVNREGQASYGYSFWINKDGYSCSGAGGQAIIIKPERQLVFAVHALADYDYNKLLVEE